MSAIDAAVQVLHAEFLGRPDHYYQISCEEYLQMKCCSYLPKDIENHYDRMTKLFYAIGAIDDVKLKQAFLNSFPEPLGAEAHKLMALKQATLQNSSIA